MSVEEALEAAQQAKDEGLQGQYPMAAQVLAAEVLRLREPAGWHRASTCLRWPMRATRWRTDKEDLKHG